MTPAVAGRIEVVSFDADGTLWDFDSTMRRALDSTIEFLACRDERLVGLNVDVLVAARQQVGAAHRNDVVATEELRLEGFRLALALQGIVDDDLARDATAHYLEARFDDPILYPDVRATLDALRADYRLALITNGNSDPQRCGLPDVFAVTVFADRFGVAKPDPRIFAEMAQQAGCVPERIAHVGDSLLNDVAGAMTAGMHAVWLDRLGDTGTNGPMKPCPMIRSLTELPVLLRELCVHRATTQH